MFIFHALGFVHGGVISAWGGRSVDPFPSSYGEHDLNTRTTVRHSRIVLKTLRTALNRFPASFKPRDEVYTENGIPSEQKLRMVTLIY